MALLRRSLRLRLQPRSPAPSTSSSGRRYFVRSWQATTVRPPVSGSAAGSSATRIASDVIVLLPTPSAAKALPWETLGGYCFSPRAQARLLVAIGRSLPGSLRGGGRRSAALTGL